MKKVIISIAIALNVMAIYSQQDAQYSMYMFNPLAVNPAYAGSRDAISITALGRQQWVGIDGAPTTGTFSFHSPLKKERIALGLSLSFDEIGSSKTTSIYGDIAYRFQVTKKSRLSFGIKGGIDLQSINLQELRVIDNQDAIIANVSNELSPNFGAGIYWDANDFYVGLTAPKLLENSLGNVIAGSLATQKRHYFAMAGKSFKLNSAVDIVPSFVLKVVENSPLSLDLNVNFLFYDKLWIGGGYRVGDAIVGNIMYHFSQKFRAGYAYDFSTSGLANFNSGSHEIMLNYDLDFFAKGFKTPRKF